MLNNCTEEDFYQLKSNALDRLSPDGVIVGSWGIFAFSGVVTAFVYNAISSSNINPVWTIVAKVNLVLLIFQFLLTLFYTSVRNAYKFQRLQSLYVCIGVFLISIEPYQAILLSCEDSRLPASMTIISIALLLFGILLLLYATIRGVWRVKGGHFRRGGDYLYKFSDFWYKLTVPAGVSFGVIMLAGVISNILSGSNILLSNITSTILMLIIFVPIQYAIALAWPEFFLLVYCKFRFKSFNIEITKDVLELQEPFIKSLSYWYNKPLAVMKSRTGWTYEKKAPFWTLLFTLVWFSVFVFIPLEILCILNLLLVGMKSSEFIESTMDFAKYSPILAFILMLIIKIILKITRKILDKRDMGKRKRYGKGKRS